MLPERGPSRQQQICKTHIAMQEQLGARVAQATRLWFPAISPETICLATSNINALKNTNTKQLTQPITSQIINPMEIKRAGSQPSRKGPADWFTGTVRIDSPFKGTDPARVAGAIVTFEPGARTAWHTHPLGQTLIVTGGCGRAQRWGGPIEEIRPGDIVWFLPGEKHWHGASPTTAITHIAIQEQLDGKAVDWLEKVTDEQYQT